MSGVLTTKEVLCYDALEHPPPLNKQIWCVSKYGIGRKDTFDPNFDIAWFPLPALSPASKARLNSNQYKPE